jgi:hypothetical protein
VPETSLSEPTHTARTLADLTVSIDSSPQNVVTLLESEGVVSIPGYVNPDVLENLREDARRLLMANGVGTAERDYHCGQSVAVDRSRWDATQYRTIACVVDAPYMKAIAHGFLGKQHHFNHEFFVTRETMADVPITGLHFDRLPTLKFFIYMYDTDSAKGALECIPGSHRIVNRIREYYLRRGVRVVDLPNFSAPRALGDPVAMEGGAGTMIVFTTDVFHRGGVVSQGRERWVLRAHTRPDPLPSYNPRALLSAQWWRESRLNPKRYWYKAADRILGHTPPDFL